MNRNANYFAHKKKFAEHQILFVLQTQSFSILYQEMRNYSNIPVLMLLSASFLLLPSFLTTISTRVILVDAAKWGWRSNEENATIKNEVEIDASAATKINSDSIRDISHSQKRFVLYNSRRLTGECRKS